MNWSSIIKFSVFHFVAITLVSTLTTLLIGADNLVKQSSIDSLFYFQAPSALVGLVVLSFYARVQKSQALLHLTVAVVISDILGFVILSALMGKLYFAPTWAIDLFITAFPNSGNKCTTHG
ncbi:hypothetical protein [Paraglaciecola mesophila]|uniref:hypothetical protein n=1 Tax=Paraglaciecola mesophila TaxID=197222 RepID=UPI001362A7FB|nr:hypothetical protein [Paraglaciecola mesophila]